MDEDKKIYISLSLGSCPDPYRPILRRLTMDFFHNRGIEPAIMLNEEDELVIEIDPGEKSQEEIDEIGRTWGNTLTERATELNGGEPVGEYWEEEEE